MKLLGFRDAPTIITFIEDTICFGQDYVFSDGSVWMNLYQDTSQISYLNSTQSGWDSLVVHNVYTRPFQESLDIQQACFTYTWIDGITYSESTNTPSITLTNQYGCDSIVQLNLTIDTVNTNIEVDALEIQSLATNATYQWLDCDDAYSALQGEATAIYEIESNGSYAVVVFQDGCTDTSDCITVETVDLSIKDLAMVGLHPNPTKGVINLRGFDALNGLKKIEIKNNLGVTLKQVKVNDLKIDLSDFSIGLYYLDAIVNDRKIRMKIIKI